MTNLFRGRVAEALLVSMGVVEPECEKAREPLECEIAAELGREVGGLLESRDFDILLDKRLSHFWDGAFGVLERELSLPSWCSSTSSAIMVFPLDLLMLLFMTFAAFSERERPKRSEGRAGNRSGGLKEKA